MHLVRGRSPLYCITQLTRIEQTFTPSHECLREPGRPGETHARMIDPKYQKSLSNTLWFCPFLKCSPVQVLPQSDYFLFHYPFDGLKLCCRVGVMLTSFNTGGQGHFKTHFME